MARGPLREKVHFSGQFGPFLRPPLNFIFALKTVPERRPPAAIAAATANAVNAPQSRGRRQMVSLGL